MQTTTNVQNGHGKLHPGALVEKITEKVQETRMTGVPSEPVLGLPVKRVIPMEVHSMLDYGGSATHAACGLIARTPEAKSASFVLAGAGAGVSLITDYEMSLAKVIPIEVHETIDYLWGAASVAAPFLLGYIRRDPIVSAVQIVNGLSTIVASLFTDYRASRGVKWRGFPGFRSAAAALSP
jgi:hypothetical protein